MVITMMQVPKDQRGQGVGARTYQEWESKLPPDIREIRFFAADLGDGAGRSNQFWDAMGFDYMYDDETSEPDRWWMHKILTSKRG